MKKDFITNAKFYNTSKIRISEQLAKDSELDIELAKNIDIKKLTEKDNNPMFVTVEALNESISGNRNYYSKEVLENIKTQILLKKPNLYKGHVKDGDEGDVTPEPMIIWLGAGVKNIKDKSRLFIKGYVLPTAKKLRTYLRTAVAVGKDFAVSVFGKANITRDFSRNINIIKEFFLDSIDWAREFNEGVQDKAGILYLTSEMKKSKEQFYFSKDKNMKVDYKNVKISELKKARPKLVEQIESDALIKISEMLKVEPNKILDEIGKTVKESQDLSKKVKEFEFDKSVRIAEQILSEKVKKPAVFNVIKTIVIAEMKNLKEYTNEAIEAKVKETLKTEEVMTLLKEQKDKTVSVSQNEDIKNQSSELISIS